MESNGAHMKVLFFINSLGSGGAQRQMIAIASHMIEKGYDIYLAWYADEDFYKSDFEKIGVHCLKYTGKSSKYKYLPFFISAVKRIKPDVVLSFLFAPTIICALGKWITFGKWKFIIRMGGNNPNTFRSMKWKASRVLLTAVSTIVCNSYAEAETWNKYCKYLCKRVLVIPNYVSISMPVDENTHQSQDGLVRILVPANLRSYIKNPLNVAKALTLLNEEERKNIVIDWYGQRYSGKTLSPVCIEVEKYIVDHNLHTCFITHDATHDIHLIMIHSDVVALFSTEEGLPNAICEGMFLSKPIIMTKVSDWKKMVNDNGLICDGMDPESIAATLRIVNSWSKEDMIRMGKTSREIASSLFNDEDISEKWLMVFSN